MKILWIADIPHWCFDRIGQMLNKYGKNEYSVRYGRRNKYKRHKTFKDIDKFDLILYPVDTRPDRIIKARIPPEKLIMLIRSDVFKLCKPKRLIYYKETKMMSRRVAAFMCANKYLYERFKKTYHTKCFYAPGGVDTELFKPSKKKWGDIPRVGWAGSKTSYGKDIRGLPMIQDACAHLGYVFKPAYREDKWRTPDEMVQYYHNDIDIYIDAFAAAGRQNGLLEAAACGLPIVSLPVGIGQELIDAEACVKIEMLTESMIEGLKMAWEYKNTLRKKAMPYIQKEWSWKTHVERWEKIFKEVK